jgi:AI-2 transport protein TqsA
MSNGNASPVLRFLVGAACFVVVTLGLREAAGPLSTVLLAALLAQALEPVRDGLRAKGLSSGMAVAVTILLMLVGGLLISSLLAMSLGQLAANAPTYRTRLSALEESIVASLQGRGLTVPDLSHLGFLEPAKLVGMVGGLAGSLLSALGNTAAVLLLMVFMLIDRGDSAADAVGEPGPIARLRRLSGQTRQYIKITASTGFIFSVVVTLVMLIVGTDGAVTWGVLGFFMNFVPNIGFIVGVIPPTVLTLLELGWGPALIVLAAFVLTNFLTDNVIKPRFMRSSLNLGLLESLLALVFFSWVFGAAGAVLSIPIYLVVKEALKSHAASRQVSGAP